ncbi:hypothetical protein [Pontibacillus salipaludis]|uniref:Chromate transporter n=1 Tax=Pontibacillus salipaludis TaxID=1697394 RepID=A0ABQ1QIV8_9BACI|nr:hypothetical protein [Pontibacillus salipaludis]GGD29011.1 hypothetical protein GCM10011389_40750 [Pontibacillus salipaludis]
MRKLILPALALGILGIFGSPFEFADILMILDRNGYDVPRWAADSLTTIGSVYGVQHYLIGAVGVTVPWFLAAAIVGAGSLGL